MGLLSFFTSLKSRLCGSPLKSQLNMLAYAVQENDGDKVALILSELHQKKVSVSQLLNEKLTAPALNYAPYLLYYAKSGEVLDMLLSNGSRWETLVPQPKKLLEKLSPYTMLILIERDMYPLIFTQKSEYPFLLRALIRQNISKYPENQKEALAHALIKATELLLDKEPWLLNTLVEEGKGVAPIVEAFMLDNLIVAKTMLLQGAHRHQRVNDTYAAKETIFTIAASKGNEKMVDMLLAQSQDLADLEAFEEEINASSAPIDNKYYEKVIALKENFFIRDVLEKDLPKTGPQFDKVALKQLVKNQKI